MPAAERRDGDLAVTETVSERDSQRLERAPLHHRVRDEMESRIAASLFSKADVRRIARFAVEDFIGAGAMGSVYLAHDPTLARRVALKLLHAGLAREDDDGEHARLLREAHALARLSHPNVVQVHEVGTHDGRVFLAMEYVDGHSLRDWQNAWRRNWREIVRTYCQAAAGLAAAHDAGVVHRDFKPSNVIVGADGRVRVADFGLARAGGTRSTPSVDDGPNESSSPSALDESLTRSGTILGTPAYMAPEQLAGASVEPAADQWSFCVALWEALYSVRPFEIGEIRRGIGATRPRPGRARGPRSVRAALTRGLSENVGGRWPSMRQLHDRLLALCGPRRGWQVASVAAVSALTALLASPDTTVDPCPLRADEIAPHWDNTRRAELLRALGQLGTGIAPRAVQRAVEDLDRYRLRWLNARSGACRAALGDEDDTARLRSAAKESCLARGLLRLNTAARLLQEADLATFAHSDELVDSLGDPATCLEVDFATLPRADAERLATLESAEVEFVARGVLPEAARALVAPSSPLWAEASPRLRAAALRVRGRTRVLEGDPEGGARDLLDGVNAAEAGRLDRMAATLWLQLVETACNQLVSLERAEAWLERARAAVERVGSPGDLALQHDRMSALVAREQGDWPRAKVHLTRAMSHARPSPATAGLLELQLAEVTARMGDQSAAAETMERVLRNWIRDLGPSHPLIADAHIYLGRLTRDMGELGRSAQHFEAAVEIRETAYGESSARVSTPLVGLADVTLRRGDPDSAKRMAARAAELQAGLPPHHVERGGALALLGAIAQTQEAHSDAAAAFMALAEEWREGPRAANRPLALNNAAWSLLQLGRTGEARGLYASLRSETPRDDDLHVVALAGLGRADHLVGELEAASVELEAALVGATELERRAGPNENPELRAEISWHLAETLDALDREPRRRCDLVATAMSRYERWPERTQARAALERLQRRCITKKEPSR
jgi:serine/threonine protein kinase/tetratricopeptide (TPR) repeat protein